jgi:uncharacterized membrane protein (UPF0182 family)
MRAPEDMPRTIRRSGGRGRVIFIVVAAIILVLLASAQELSTVYTDYLWYDSVNFTSVWKNILFTKVALGAGFTIAFALVLWINLVIADRIAPKFRPLSPEDELLSRYQAMIDRRAGWVRVVVALFFGLLVGAGESAQWQQWLLFVNGGDFNQVDNSFHKDVGFYVFQLPFIDSVLNWVFASLIVIVLITAVAHYLNGGIRLQVATERVTPQVKRHLSLLLAAIALVKFVSYYYSQFELVFSKDGVVNGATYTPYTAQLNAIYLLMFASGVAFLCFLVNIWRRGWMLPILAVVLWGFVAVVAGEVYPAIVQKFVVQPAESDKEKPYLVNNIEATRQSYNLGDDHVDKQSFDFNPDVDATKAGAEANPSTVRNIRLLDPRVVQPSYQQLQGLFNFYKFSDLDIDRYPMKLDDGTTAKTAVVLAGRDLSNNPSDLPQPTWEGAHIAYTHGYGVALAAVNATTTSGSPGFSIANVPVTVDTNKIDTKLDTPGLYFGERMPNYAITGATRNEVAYLAPGGQTVEERYNGKGGVQLDSLLKRFAFSRRFGDNDILVSQFITDQSKILYLRDVRDRVEYAAPFLSWDTDPYPVVANGRITYVIDGYTTSPFYPNAQSFDSDATGEVSTDPDSVINEDFNYIRNSVKATVDAYDGTVTLYVWDPSDPVVNAYKAAFPSLFSEKSQMPATILDHVRYPEDMFRVQTAMYGRYHLTDPTAFYQRTGAWSVAQEPSASVAAGTNTPAPVAVQQNPLNQARPAATTTGDKIPPFYELMRLPKETDDSFVLFRTFVPFASGDSTSQNSSQKLTSFIVAKSDFDSYGKLVSYELPSPPSVDGPTLVDSRINADPDISRDISLLTQQGSKVQFGNMLLIPFGDTTKDGNRGTLIWVRPLYVTATGRPVPELKKVIVAVGNGGDSQVIMRDTLRQALIDLFHVNDLPTLEGQPDTQPGQNPATATTTTTSTSTTTPGGSTSSTSSTSSTAPTSSTIPSGDVAQLIAGANDDLTQAEAARKTGDLATYQQKVTDAATKIARAAELQNQASSSTTTAPSAPSA